MKHSLPARITLAIVLSVTSTYLPQYCSTHKTLDLCWIREVDKNGGLGGEYH